MPTDPDEGREPGWRDQLAAELLKAYENDPHYMVRVLPVSVLDALDPDWRRFT